MKKEFQLTKEGIMELESELRDLKVQSIEVIEAIKTARDQGDLKENDEYHSAKEDQERVVGRINEIEHILANSEVIKAKGNGSVGLGNTIVLKSGRKEATYHIVDSVEADPLEAKISDESPIGKALMGQKVGEKIEIDLPAGKISYEIIKIL